QRFDLQRTPRQRFLEGGVGTISHRRQRWRESASRSSTGAHRCTGPPRPVCEEAKRRGRWVDERSVEPAIEIEADMTRRRKRGRRVFRWLWRIVLACVAV